MFGIAIIERCQQNAAEKFWRKKKLFFSPLRHIMHKRTEDKMGRDQQ